MTELPIYQVAAFTDAAFGGNPAAVVLLDEWLDAALMQKIATENNLSETAFIVPEGHNNWQIRWFTPSVEVPLCGHATLASAAVIRSKLGHNDWPVTLNSASGPLIVDVDGDSFILDLPTNNPILIEPPDGLEEAMGVIASEVYLANDIYLLLLADENTVATLKPDFVALADKTQHGVIVSAPGEEVDFVSRFFAPAIGIAEDPVTGAAHCVLTPYWSRRLGKKKMVARQISARSGVLQCEYLDPRVKLSGQAVFFLSGTISI